MKANNIDDVFIVWSETIAQTIIIRENHNDEVYSGNHMMYKQINTRFSIQLA